MEEQLMFTRVHDALDIPTPPGAYERLRTQLIKKPVRPFRWPALQMRVSSMGFRLAAGLVVVAIAVAAAAAALAIHNSTNNVSPAGSRMSIQAYQKMIEADFAAADATYSAPCGSPDNAGCGADATRGIPVVQKWIKDVSRPDIPLRFVVINAEMRQVLLQNISAQEDLLAASKANDNQGMDRALWTASYAAAWTSTVTPGITESRQVDAVTYANHVKQQVSEIKYCLVNNCILLVSADARSCTINGGVPCQQLFDMAAIVYATFAAALVQYAAPDALADKDARLQSDLAATTSAFMNLRAAIGANNQSGINSGIDQLQRLTAVIEADAAKITG
ncbi:MAG TPA: hypothetical protein VFR33_05615 [Candidatus Dormibacteraeota bacterium]|nr:hypothetical protein [Candidatus Dormibacteraeota bacterium]